MRQALVRGWLRGLCAASLRAGYGLCLLLALGCGRVGVHLLPPPAAPASDAGTSIRPDATNTDSGGIADTGMPAGGGMAPYMGTAADAGAPAKDAAVASCMDGACPMLCTDDAGQSSAGICGCGVTSTADSDGDGLADCVDFCPGSPDRLEDGTCGCTAAKADADGDGAPNCSDLCPFDRAKVSPLECGCGVSEADADTDGTPDCSDSCANDRDKTRPGVCGCGVSEADTDLDGMPDCVDACKGGADTTYVSNAECGVGYCQQHNVPSSCVAGVETACVASAPLSADDATCDGVDDDCDGNTDEEFTSRASSCGKGVCAATGVVTCVAGATRDSCTPGAPRSSTDTTCDRVDDNCNGTVDEGFVVTMSMCSTGACASTGSIACVDGALVDSCAARAPTSSTDTTCNNVDDNCNGSTDEGYVSQTTTCGVGVCARTGSTSCVRGSVTNSCSAGAPTSSTDTSCNNLDDNCNGMVDEGYVVTSTSCGVGACVSNGSATCLAGVVRDSCVAKTPTTTVDDSFAPGNRIDDDCDGKVDENVPGCNTTPLTYEAGSYTISVPGNCHNVSVKLWGGGGASGQAVGGSSGGNGGPGGYSTASVQVSGTITLYVGGAAAAGCGSGGSNAGSASYAGGSGGTNTGDNGADGAVAGGGSGGQPGSGYRGGDGHYGGGGGGQGKGSLLDLGGTGNAGGGGAASVFVVNGVRAAVAGGGGGGGGAKGSDLLNLITSAGGAGGSGCRGNGQVATNIGGGGGGGGMCQGATTQAGSGTQPAFSGSIPSGRAAGGSGACRAGGGGYAIVTFSP